MRLRIKPFLLWSIVMILLSFSLTPVESASADAEPMVIVAYDNTQSCHQVLTRNVHTNNATKIDSPCSPGSVISTKEVKLSEAVANKDNYVIIPPQPWSIAVKEKLHNDVVNLMHAKGSEVKARAGLSTESVIKPNVSCGQTDDLLVYFTQNNSTISNDLVYQVGSDCTYVYLETITLHSTGDTYWDYSKYAASTWGAGCTDVGVYQRTITLNSTQSPGYYFEPWVTSVLNCYYGFNYTDMGPVD